MLNSEINVKDKRWFLFNACGLTTKQRIELALRAAKLVLPIYEEKYPDDKRVRECLEAIDLFNEGKITRDELLEKRRAAAAAAAADAYDAYDADAYAKKYTEKFIQMLIDFVNEQD